MQVRERKGLKAALQLKQNCQTTCIYVTVIFCGVKAESDLNFSMIGGGGADAEQDFLGSERTRRKKMRLRPPLVTIEWQQNSRLAARDEHGQDWIGLDQD